jgi:hypothetical protein
MVRGRVEDFVEDMVLELNFQLLDIGLIGILWKRQARETPDCILSGDLQDDQSGLCSSWNRGK